MFGSFGLGGEPPPPTGFAPQQSNSSHFYPQSFLDGPAANTAAAPAELPATPTPARLSQVDFRQAVQGLIFGARVSQQADFAKFATSVGAAQLESLEDKIDNLVTSSRSNPSVTSSNTLTDMLDTNHDGVVSDGELLSAGDAAFDDGRTGAVDQTEFSSKALDDMLDTNHDGVLSNSELLHAGDAAFSTPGEVVYGTAPSSPGAPRSPASVSPIYAVINKTNKTGLQQVPGGPPTNADDTDSDTDDAEEAGSGSGGDVAKSKILMTKMIKRWRKASARDIATIAAAIVEDARKMKELQSTETSLAAQLKRDREVLVASMAQSATAKESAVENMKDAAKVAAQVDQQHKQYRRRSMEDGDKQTQALNEDERRLREMLRADIITAAETQLAGDAAASVSSRPAKLILGTMNIIGDAENPIEFEPNAADLAHVTGGAEAFAKAKAEATVAFGSCTVAKCIAAVSNSALLSSKLASFVAAAAFEGTASVAALCTSKKLDLGLDNKWTAGRFNPIVFGMAAMGSGCLDNPTMLQLKHASSKPGEYFQAVLSYYEAKWPADATAELSASIASLLMWDLLCAAAVAVAPLAFATLVEASFLVKPGTTEPIAKDMLLRTLFYPLSKSAKKHTDASFIIGCQEMPREEGVLEGSLPIGMSVYRAPTTAGLVTGFVYSDVLAASFADVSDRLRPELSGWLSDQGVDAKIITTTMSRLVFGHFEVPDVGKVVVANFHCKSFKNQAAKQGVFVAHALARAAATFGCTAYAVGDMNIEAKWPKGTSAADQAAAVQAAPLGKLPLVTIANATAFGESLAAGGYAAFPEAGTLTTLKMRTKFQGQPEKEGDLTAVHKDYIIVPASASQSVSEVVIAGREDKFANNLSILQPNRIWPSDHFGIFVSL